MTKLKENQHTNFYEAILENIAPELHPFIDEHHQTWGLMKKVRNANENEESIELYCHALKVIAFEIEHHFKNEEKIILTRLKSYFPNQEVGPIAKLIDEHRSIEAKYVEVHKLANINRESKELIKEIKMLAYLVMKHIEKEDHYFYPMVSQILNEEEKKEIYSLLKG